MKKLLCFFLVVFCMIALPSCSKSQTFSGMIEAHDRENKVLYFTSHLGQAYAFLIDETTEIIWEDEEMRCLYERYLSGSLSFFWRSIQADIIPGEELHNVKLDYYEGTGLYENIIGCFHADKIIITQSSDTYVEFTEAAKPVIYLYPEAETDVSVKLNYDGKLTCTYPAYENGWSVTAAPDGTLTDAKGQTYNYLYWEGITNPEYDFSQGFCVPGEDTAAFLEDALAKLGLTRREANEFIVYWLPLMEANPYNLISFQTDAYTDHAELEISPAPDTLIRVFMAWKPLEEAMEIPAQTLTAPERTGFTAVEWGGSQID